jgi:predicted nucleic acid-binding protein
MSDATIAELKEVPLRTKFVAKYPFVTAAKVAAFVAEIEALAVRISKPPLAFMLPRDPKDEPFIDLAVAGGAQFIVTWNERHLTYLMNRDTPEGMDFCTRYPKLWIISPPAFLGELRRRLP